MSERADSACLYNLGGHRGGGRKREEGMLVRSSWIVESRKIVLYSTASCFGDFPGGTQVKTLDSTAGGVGVRSLDRELRSHMLCSQK